MLISEKHRKVVLNLRNPERVTTVIPTAKTFEYKGRTLVAVPHCRDEVKVLRNLGIKAPEPVRHYYSWPGQLAPFHAQRETASMLTSEPQAYVLSDMGCVDADTEYLSPTGWARIADYAGGQVAQYHPDNGGIEFVEPTEFVKRPCEYMVRLKTKYGIDQMLSPEHRVLLSTREDPSKTEVCSASELYNRQQQWLEGNNQRARGRIGWCKAAIPNTFSHGGAGIALSDEQLRLQVAVIADGYFANGTDMCAVRLKKERKKERLRRLLDAAGVSYRESSCLPAGFSRFSFVAPLKRKVFGPEFWNCSNAQLQIIADEVMHWDGSVSSEKPTERFSSSVRESADFVQFAFCATGRTARVLEATRVKRGREEVEFTVQVRQDGRPLMLCGVASDGTKRPNASIERSADGHKYCFVVPSAFLVFRRNGCVFLSGNTGKTMSVLWAYDYLRETGVLRKMLVVAPLSTVDDTWLSAVHGQFFHLNAVVVHGTRERRFKLLREDADVFIINHDGLKTVGIVEAIRARGDIDLIVLDELAVFRNTGTDRWEAANALCNPRDGKKGPMLPRPWVWGLTGTPMPNAPTDAFGQCRLVTPHTVPKYYGKFRDLVMRQVGPYKWEPRDNAVELVHRAMVPAVRFTMEECVDLPEQLYQTREVSLSPEQAVAYNEMVRRLKTEYDGGQITASNEAVKATKLLQICCGVVYNNTGTATVIPAKPRLAELVEIIEQASAKVIVFVPFTEALAYVAEHLSERWGVAVIQGSVSKSERARIFREFRSDARLNVLVAEPRTMSHGLTLVAANTIVWFAPCASNETYQQACARVRRPGQTRTTLIVHMAGSPIERKAYARLEKKQKLQGTLLDMFKEVPDARLTVKP